MKWNVYIYDVNRKAVVAYNIFNHYRFAKDCKEAADLFAEDKDGFLEEVKSCLMYCFWSKCEWEIIISDWPPHLDYPNEKIDAYDQVCLNWDVFADYIWEHKDELKKIDI